MDQNEASAAMTGIATSGGVSGVVNLALWAVLNPQAERLWKAQRWFVRPLFLAGVTAAAGAAGGVVAGLSVKGALLASFVGLASSITSPLWRQVWEKTLEDAEEELTDPGSRRP